MVDLGPFPEWRVRRGGSGRWTLLDPGAQEGEERDTGRGSQARTAARSALSPRGTSSRDVWN